MLAPPWKPSSLSSRNSAGGEERAEEDAGHQAQVEGGRLVAANSTRVSTSAEGPVKLSAWIGCGSNEALLTA
jgi:hypothetical protein